MKLEPSDDEETPAVEPKVEDGAEVEAGVEAEAEPEAVQAEDK
jgi:hypothetical protein